MGKIELLKSFQRAISLSQWCGLFPILLRKGTYHPSITMIIMSATICVGFSFMTLNFCVKNIGLTAENISLSKEIDYVDMFFMNSVPIVSLYELIFSFDSQQKMLFHLKCANCQLLNLGRVTEYSTNCRALVVNVGLALMAFLIRIGKNSLYRENVIMTTVERLYYLALTGMMIIIVQRFNDLLTIVSSLFRSCKKEVISYSITPGRTSRLEKLVYVHNTLNLCSTLLGDSHGVQVLVIILCCFIIFVCELYKSYMIVKGELGANGYLALAVKQCWVAVSSSLCYQIVKACRRCCKEVSSL